MAKRQYDFTVGNPGKSLILFSLPMMASSILQNLYNLADTIIVGRYVSEGALAAVSTCGTITLVLTLLISGATQGVSIMISQYYGAKDEVRVKRSIWNGMIIIIGIGILCSLLGVLFTKPILQLIQVPGDILGDAIVYLRIICIFLLATVMYNLAFSISRSLGDSATPMVVLAVCCVLNIGLNLLFVLRCHMGVAGVAYGTVVSTIISAVICWVILWIKMPVIRPTLDAVTVRREVFAMVARLGVSSALTASTSSIGALILHTMVNRFGTTVMAAYGAAIKLEALVSYPPGGLTMAMSVFTGQNIGAGKYDRIHKGYKAAVKLILGYSLFTALVLISFGKPLMGLFTVEGGEIINIGYRYLLFVVVGAFPCGLLYLGRYTLTGAGDASMGAKISLLELACCILGAFLLSRYTPLGFYGVFLGHPVGYLVGGIVATYRYKVSDLEKKRLVQSDNLNS